CSSVRLLRSLPSSLSRLMLPLGTVRSFLLTGWPPRHRGGLFCTTTGNISLRAGRTALPAGAVGMGRKTAVNELQVLELDGPGRVRRQAGPLDRRGGAAGGRDLPGGGEGGGVGGGVRGGDDGDVGYGWLLSACRPAIPARRRAVLHNYAPVEKHFLQGLWVWGEMLPYTNSRSWNSMAPAGCAGTRAS